MVFEPALELITALVPCEDAYTQERALLGAVLERVQGGDLWIGDRNLCTARWIEQVHQRAAAMLVREHEQVRWTALEAMREVGRTASGAVAEQRVRLGPGEAHEGLVLRRIRLHLDQPTRNGETTSVPADHADTAGSRCLHAGHAVLDPLEH